MLRVPLALPLWSRCAGSSSGGGSGSTNTININIIIIISSSTTTPVTTTTTTPTGRAACGGRPPTRARAHAQLLLRLLRFGLNAVALHYVTTHVLGLVNVRLALLHSTLLFFAREPFRRACLSCGNSGRWPAIRNLVWAAPLIGTVLAAGLAFLWIRMLERPPAELDYAQAVSLYAASALLELLCEPLWILAQIEMRTGLRTAIDAVAASVRTLLIVGWLILRSTSAAPSTSPLMIFTWAQLALGAVYLVAYYGFYVIGMMRRRARDRSGPLTSLRDLVPHRAVGDAPWTDPDLLLLTRTFLKQSLAKQVLSEGEQYIMTFASAIDLAEQGVYSAIGNLGSMITRFLFAPLEESYYVFFASLLRTTGDEAPPRAASVRLAAQTLQRLMKFSLLCGLLTVVIGVPYARVILHLYGGVQLSAGSGPLLLRANCWYMLLLAVNGITECFVMAAASAAFIDHYARVTTALSLAFLLITYVLSTLLGSVGFVLANGINMLARILVCGLFIRQYFHAVGLRPLAGAVPDVRTWAALAATYAVGTLLEPQLVVESDVGIAINVHRLLAVSGAGAACLALVLATVVRYERDCVAFALTLVPGQRRPLKQA